MALTTNFNVDPYYDDFNEDKNYHRVLFKPGYAVQSRELTQAQTTLQDQIKKFGDHIFQSGSIVSGGQITIQNCAYLNIASTFSGQDIAANTFNQQTILNTANTKRAYILTSYSADSATGDPITFIINQLYGAPFTDGESIYTSNTDTAAITYYANTASSNSSGNSQAFSVNSGVFYYEGYFVKTQPQSVAVSKYSRTGNSLIGFVVSEDIIDYSEDTTLLDPAQSSSNFQAPGADRYKISMTLANRPIDSTDLTQFIELSTIQNGLPLKIVQTPIYASIGDEFARRTADESGDYVIKPFQIALDDSGANSAYANVTLSPGKAYIKGYEFSTMAPSTLTIPKPRTTDSIQNSRINSEYGYYVFANSLFGNFATNQYANVELSLLNAEAANCYLYAGNPTVYNNTVIGNTKIKLVSFYSATGNTLDSNNYIYKVYLTDINTNSIGANNNYGTNAAGGGSVSTVIFPSGYAANNDVYKGLKIRMVAGVPSQQAGDNLVRVITDYVGSSLTATVNPPFQTAIGSDHRFIIDTAFSSVESLIVRNSASKKIAHANISPLSKTESIGAPPSSILTSGGVFQPVSVQESEREPLLLKIGQPNIADNTIIDFAYSYKRLYQTVGFTSGVSQTLSIGTGESLQAATTTASKQQYYQLIVTSSGGSPYPVGKTIDAQHFSVDTASRTISVGGGSSMAANIYAVINASNPTSKTKTFIKANTQLVVPGTFGSNSIFASGNNTVYVSSLDGQTVIAESFVIRKPGQQQYLFAADVHSINAVFDFAGSAVNQSTYNALDKSAGSSANVTSRYLLSTGQKDSYYDWGGIVLKPGQTGPRGPLLVRYNRFKSTGTGFFNVDSYTRLGSQQNGGLGIDYGDVPIFTSEDGNNYKLVDYLDFRPVRKDATSSYTANTFVLDVEEAGAGPKITEPGLDILMDYQYYLARVDRVVLNKNRQFVVLQGTPSLKPTEPLEPDDAMTLYILTYPPYLTYPSSTGIKTFSNRRYTMKDIGLLDKRITNLELYTSLNLAELTTLSKQDKTVRDQVGLSRPKNGVFTDAFSDKGGAFITSPDYSAAIDIIGQECRGSYNITSTKIFSNNSIANFNVEVNGPVLMLASSNTTFVSQNKSSTTLNINPFNVINYIGNVRLDPPSDVWKSTTRLESQNIDLTGGDAARDAWSSIQSTSWGAWDTQWTTSSEQLDSTTTRSVSNLSGSRFYTAATGAAAAAKFAKTGVASGPGLLAVKGDVTTTTTTNTRESQTLNANRTGILSQIVPQSLTQSLGDRLIDLSIVNYMREKNVLILGEKFKPFTTLNAFFDNTKVNQYIGKINRFQFEKNNLQYQTTLSNAETVTIYKATSNTSLAATDTVIGTGGVVLTSNNNGFIVNLVPTAAFGSWSSCATNGIWIKGNSTGATNRVVNWYHSTGIALAGSASTITLNYNAGGASESADYVGQTIYIIYGTGQGQSAVIQSYDSATRVATIVGNWTVNPTSSSVYSIGQLETTEEGATAGVFIIPGDVFRTGEKLLRLIDDEFGNIENSRTNGDASFYASGVIDTKQESSITVFTPTVQRSSVTEGFSASTSSIKTASSVDTQKNVVVGYYDPLAQTFLINPNQYSQGVVIDSVRVCFRTKDKTAPVSLQLRPVQNGYPSSSTIYPYAEKTLTPDKVNVTAIPDMNDPNKYTEFKFDVPILLLPGEHSFVLVSNSNGYEAFVAEIGATDIRTSTKISEQPYTGSLFLSQNGSTWTADQMKDLMFTIQKRVFSNGVGFAFFETDVSEYSANAVYDVAQLMSTDAVVANTSLQYDFISEMETGGQHTLLPIIPNIDYEMNDGYGRRILSTTTGNTTFQLRATLSSSNPDISPIIDINRLNLLSIENKINNMELQNTGFIIVNGGSGYLGNASLTFSNETGAGASAVGIVESGVLTKIQLTNPGTGYITSPTVVSNASAGTTATILYNGEDKSIGGNSIVRHITKKVQLASGFDAGDLRVYMDAYKPPGSNILVYYKLLSASDSSSFETNNYQLMTQLTDLNFVSSGIGDYAELTFAPGTYGTGVPDNRVQYIGADGGIFKDFVTFAIKVVMYGTDKVDVPKFGNLRVIALPASSVISVT